MNAARRPRLPIVLATGLAAVLGGAAAVGAAALLHRPAPAAAEAPKLGNRADCAAYGGLPAGWPQTPHAGMRAIAGGAFALGSTRGYADERPLLPTQVRDFWIDRTEVTNAQFAAFVAATGYVTEAERGGGAAVFGLQAGPTAGAPVNRWWRLDPGADWRHPEGPGSGIEGRGHEPVVAVTHADAEAYANWLGHRLPTEAEWEWAAKAGLDNEQVDAALRTPDGSARANFWQGLFPVDDRGDDGYAGRAPVGCFEANAWGLHDMVGNVWEWTADAYRERAQAGAPPLSATAPRVIKGGSFLCAENYCVRARASSRQPQDIDLGADHIGFRTVADRP